MLHKQVYFADTTRTGLKSSATLVTAKPLTGQSRTGLKSQAQFWTLAPLFGNTRTGSRSSSDGIRTVVYKNEPIREDKSTPVFVYDRNEKMRLILSDDTVPYTGEIPGELNGPRTIELDVMATDSRVAKIVNEGRLVTQDEEYDFVEFIIRTVEDAENGIKHVEGEGSEYELIDEWLESYIQPSVDVKTALGAILEGTRWSVGEIDSYEQRSVELKHMSKRRAVNELIDMFNLEVKYTVETRGNRVVNRKINLYQSRGQDTGRRFEKGKDILSAKRVYDSTDIKTALYGLGAADENGKRLTFKDVEWKASRGDPADKPLGQTWIGDPIALGKWGAMGGRKHKSGGYDGQEEDAATLLLNTWNELQQQNKLRDTYEVSVVNLGEILEYPHERVRLGDRVLAVDHDMVPVLESQAHIVGYRHNLNDRRLSTCTLGHFRARVNTDRSVADLEKDWNDKRGEFDKKPTAEEVEVKANNEATRAIAEAQLRIDAAKLELETSMKNIELGKEKIIGLNQDLLNLNTALDGKLPYGMAAADVNASNTKILGKNLVVDGNTTVTGVIAANGAVFNSMGTNNMTANNATIANAVLTGIFDAPYARIQKAALEDVVITGTLTGVKGTFVGDLIGARILSGSSINVTTDLYVGNNIYLGASLAGSKRIYFNQNANFTAEDANIIVNADTLKVGNSFYGSAELQNNARGTKLQFAYGTSRGAVYQDNYDRGRLKLETSPGNGIWLDPNGNIYQMVNGVVVRTFYSNGTMEPKT